MIGFFFLVCFCFGLIEKKVKDGFFVFLGCRKNFSSNVWGAFAAWWGEGESDRVLFLFPKKKKRKETKKGTHTPTLLLSDSTTLAG